MTGFFRGAAIALLCATTSLIGGCGGGGSSTPVVVAGRWAGTLNLSYLGGGASFGALSLVLDQEQSFVSGIAEWSPAKDTLSIAGPVDGAALTLRLNFRCLDPDTGVGRPADTVLSATVDGETLLISGGSGLACPTGGEGVEVAGATGTLTRTSNASPL